YDDRVSRQLVACFRGTCLSFLASASIRRILHVFSKKGTLMHVKKIALCAAVLVFGLAFTVIASDAQPPAASAAAPKFYEWALTPPMGWNSWDAFGSSVKEEQVLANADYMDKYLKSHGWNLITIDIQWYEPTAQKDQYRRGAALEMDAYGR